MINETPIPGSAPPLPPFTWNEACRILYKAHGFIMQDESYRKQYEKNYENRATELDFVPEKEDPDYKVIYNHFRYKSAAAEGKSLRNSRTDAMNMAWHENLKKFGKLIVDGPDQTSDVSSETRRKKSMHGMMRVMAHNMLDVLQNDDDRINLACQTGVEYNDLQRIKNEFVVLPPPSLKRRISERFSASQTWLKKQYGACINDYCSSCDALRYERDNIKKHRPTHS